MSPSRSRAGTRPKSSSAAGRSSTASRRTSWRVRPRARAARRPRLARRPASARLQRFQPEQDRRQRLPGLVVQLAGETRALQLLRLDDAAHGVAADPLGEVDRGRRARRERLGEPEVVVGEARCRRPSLSWATTTPIARPSHDERDVERRADPHPPRDLLVHLRIVEHGVDALAPPPLEARARSSSRRARARFRRLRPSEPSPSAAATRRRSPSASASAMRTSRASTSSRSRRRRGRAAAELDSRRRARSRSRSATRAGASHRVASRTGGCSRSRPRPGRRAVRQLLVLLREARRRPPSR